MMKLFTERFKNTDIRTQKILLWFLRFSNLFLIYGLIYYTDLLNKTDQFIYLESIYAFLESAFYLPAIGISSAILFEWMIRKNK